MQQEPTLWQRFLLWLDGKNEPDPPERLKLNLPGSGNTDILLSASQKKHLEDAMQTPAAGYQTSFYSRDTSQWKKSSKPGGNPDLII